MFELKVGRTVAVIDDEDAHLAGRSWRLTSSGYAVDRDGQRLHRVILGLARGDEGVDHLNGNRLDCRRANLRVTGQTENTRNLDGPNAHNRDGRYLGVSWVPATKRFLARICVDKKVRYLGVFKTAEEAHEARLAAEKRLWGVQPRRAHHFEKAVASDHRPE